MVLSLVGVAAFALVGACSFSVSLEPLDDGQCGEGKKACNERCVLLTDANYGCKSPVCAPCILLNAQAVCSPVGECAIAACIGTYRDCDDLPETGCEIDVNHDPDHCGDCQARPCQTENGTPGCSAGKCATGACNEGFGDCNEEPGDGCETDVTSDPAHCQSCSIDCNGGTCVAGRCM